MSVTYQKLCSTECIKIVVPGEPVAQGRPRFTSRGGYPRAYDPAKSRDYKERIRDELKPLFLRREPFKMFGKGNPCSLSLSVYRAIPKRFTKQEKALACQGELRPTTKPDTDNYLKGVLDALNGVIFEDDSQVTDISAKKLYSDEPRIEVTVIGVRDGT